MICPHCNKPISFYLSDECLKRARELREKGYSLRDIEKMLAVEGHHASFSNLSRHFRKAALEGK